MIRINQIKISPALFAETEKMEAEVKAKVMKILRVQEEQIEKCKIIKQSIDARKKPDVFFSLVVDVKVKREEEILKRCKDPNVSLSVEHKYKFPKMGVTAKIMEHRPVIIGSGPAGLFCAYMLAIHGYKPIVVERGEDADNRFKSVEHFWKTGELNPNSNVQFGEGGAGTFSDGKLNTLVKDKDGRNREVLNIFVKAGAPEKITYESKPHLGTDILIPIVKNMRATIIKNGGKVLFNSEVTDVLLEGNQVKGVVINGKETIECEVAVLAIGHSARNTLEMLYQKGIPMEAKSFAVGLRVEHPQTVINQSQYGAAEPEYLSAAPYKVTAQTSNGHGVYSFCMCPGGFVVNASSEEGMLAVNGMSYSKRDARNANSAIIVSVTPEDYKSDHPLAGIRFQQDLEKKAYKLGNGKIPVQYYKDFKENVASIEENGENMPEMKGQYTYANVRSLMSEAMNLAFMEGMEKFDRSIKGFASDNTLLSGIESRTSSPVRIHRDEESQSTVLGLYPCGEGAGYAGGINSAAMDGIKTAEEIAKKYSSF